MTQEEKQLLLKDLCSRLPYGVWVNFRGNIEVLHEVHIYQSVQTVVGISGNLYDVDMPNIKPYLRPMSSMTEEEWIKFYKWAYCRIEKDSGEIGSKSRGYCEGYEYLGIDDMSDVIDWLNAHHFDYRGLIEKGLALEAPEGMYKTE